MMMTEKMTYRWLWSCLVAGGLLLLSGCSGSSSDDDLQQPEQVTLQLRAVTRTDGAFEIPDANKPASNIKLFLATLTPTNENPNNYSLTEGSFSYKNSQWSSTNSLNPLIVKEETPYYLYGYMPSSISATQSAPDGDYSKGINLSFTGLPAITSDDICVLVGVQLVGANSTDSPTVTEGQYGFRSNIKGQNYVNLLMAHLYTRLKVSFKIDPNYAELRSIHLKEVTLTSKYADGASVTVNLRSGQGIGSPSFPSGSEGDVVHTMTLFKSSAIIPEKVLDKALANQVDPSLVLDLPAYCRPVAVEGTYNLTLTTTYDVYDLKGQNLGERVSENKIKFDVAEVKPGQEKKLVLTVKPTYLYVLSDNDADNPTITLGE